MTAGEQGGSLRLDGASCSTDIHISYRDFWVVRIEGKEWLVAKNNGELMEPLDLPDNSLRVTDLREARSDQTTAEEV